MAPTKLPVLLVEDNDFDVKRVRRGFSKLGREVPIERARDGVEALEFLQTLIGDEVAKQQIIVILDLNMPRMGGLEFLDHLRANKRLRSTPVFVVTTSDFHLDVSSAHNHMVSGYFVKPNTSEEMTQVLQILSDFWDQAIYVD